MPKFKIGDLVTNGKIEYTITEINEKTFHIKLVSDGSTWGGCTYATSDPHNGIINAKITWFRWHDLLKIVNTQKENYFFIWKRLNAK